MTYILFAVSLLLLSMYSWGFVDPNAPFFHITVLRTLVYQHRDISSVIYLGLLVLLFGWYLYIAKKKSIKHIMIYLGILIGVLAVSYPAFSNDIFNYIATARVTYAYHENPYIIMPIDIVNEPMLKFLQAANKTALYGPTWIAITAIPYLLGLGNLLITMYMMKAVAVAFYIGVTYLIWKFTKRPSAVVLFAFNPLVIIDTLVDAHNDVVMMFFALSAFYVLRRKQYVLASVLLLVSILVKGATLFVIPVFVYAVWSGIRENVRWENIWTLASYSMFVVFMLSPIREEMYSWYFIWVLSFVVLRKRFDVLTVVSLAFTFGLPLRFLPFVYTGEWGGVTPVVKKIVTFIPPVVAGLGYKYARR